MNIFPETSLKAFYVLAPLRIQKIKYKSLTPAMDSSNSNAYIQIEFVCARPKIDKQFIDSFIN